MLIKDFKKRFNKALVDPIQILAEELHKEGYTEEDVFETIKKFPCLPYPQILHLRNCIRDIERKE